MALVGGCGSDNLGERDNVHGWDPNPRQQWAFLGRGMHGESCGERKKRMVGIYSS